MRVRAAYFGLDGDGGPSKGFDEELEGGVVGELYEAFEGASIG